jgi:hypothetical protein
MKGLAKEIFDGVEENGAPLYDASKAFAGEKSALPYELGIYRFAKPGVLLKEALKVHGKITNSLVDEILQKGGKAQETIRRALPCYTGTCFVFEAKDKPFGDRVFVVTRDVLLIFHIPEKFQGLRNAMLVGVSDQDYDVTFEDDPEGKTVRAMVKEGLIHDLRVDGLTKIHRDVIAHIHFKRVAVLQDWGAGNGHYYSPEELTGIGCGPGIGEKEAWNFGIPNYRRHITSQGGECPQRADGGLVVRGMIELPRSATYNPVSTRATEPKNGKENIAVKSDSRLGVVLRPYGYFIRHDIFLCSIDDLACGILVVNPKRMERRTVEIEDV